MQVEVEIKKCRRCGILLTNDNWYPSCKKYYKYICKDCSKKFESNATLHRIKLRIKIKNIIGNKCIFCHHTSSNNRFLVFHEIRAKKHTAGNLYYVLRNVEDFVPLCGLCHKGVHWCMKCLQLSWEEILQLWREKNV